MKRRLIAAAIAIATLVGLALTAPTADAATTAKAGYQSLVYIKGGSVYVSHPDGTHPVMVRKGSYWRWPSMDDHGIIAAEARDGRKAPDGSTGYSIYRMTQWGTVWSTAPTPLDYSVSSCPRLPSNHISLSPDGTKVAYDFFSCNEQTTVWAPAKQMTFPHQGAGQEDYHAPVWINNSKLLATHVGVRVAGGREAGTFTTAGGQDSTGNWFDADSWATAFTSATTRDGRKIAILEDDGADYFDGVPRHVSLVLGTAAGLGQPVHVTCHVPLPVTQYTSPSWRGISFASLSFKADGSALVWDGQSGLWRATTSTISSCGTLKAHLWMSGAYDGSFSPAIDKR